MRRFKNISAFAVLLVMIVSAFGSVTAEANSGQPKWASKQNFKFTVNGKEQEPWEYHEENTWWNCERDMLFCINGKYISISTKKLDNLYIGTERLVPEYKSKKELTEYLNKKYGKEMREGLDAFIKQKAKEDIEYDEEELTELLEKESNWEWNLDYYELLTDYCHLNDKERILNEIKCFITKINNDYFWIPASEKEQTIKVEATLKGKPVKDNKNYYYLIGASGSAGGVILSPFGEPVDVENRGSEPDYSVDYNDGKITVPANWNGLITYKITRFETGSRVTFERPVVERIYVVNDISVKSRTMNIYENRSEQIELLGRTEKITYKTADDKIAKVDKKGVVTGLKTGKTVVTVYKNKKSIADIDVTVYKPRLMTSRLMLGVNEEHKLVLWGTDANIMSVSSSDKSVAKVSKKGVITAKKKGTATITVTDTDGRTYTCKVYVWKTSEEILERIENDPNYQAHPIGDEWGFGSFYKGWKGGSINPGTRACNGYAALISDAIMDNSKAYYYDDPYGLLPGDIVYIKKGETERHYITVVDVDYSHEEEGEISYRVYNGNVHDTFDEDGYALPDIYSLSDFYSFGDWREGCTGIDYIISRYDDKVYKIK